MNEVNEPNINEVGAVVVKVGMNTEQGVLVPLRQRLSSGCGVGRRRRCWVANDNESEGKGQQRDIRDQPCSSERSASP